MQRGWLVLPLLGLAAAVPLVHGAALDLPFIRGLRDKGYYDYALFEIDRIAAKKDVAADLRTKLDFERAITQLQYARSLVNPESQAKELDRAAKSLADFVQSHPNDPLTANAHRERAQILLDRARVEMWQLHPDDPPAKQQAAQSTARQLIGEARTVFQQTHDRAKQAYDQFPKTRIDDPKVRQERQRVESDYLRAQLSLAICTFEEALTYEPKADERRKTLSRAADEFEAIHVKYRVQGAGLRALMWEGKCFEEQGDLRKASGIYNDLLRNGSDNEVVRQINDHVTQFRLACLNDDSMKDYAVVVNEATQWLAGSKDRQRTSVGRGIRWQRAVANERVAASKETAASDRERALRSAVDDAREVSRFPGEFQTAALTLMSRHASDVAAGSKKGNVRDFAGGFGMARKNLDDIQALKARLDSAGSADKPKIEHEFKQLLDKSARQLMQVLAAADARTDRRELNQARYFLAFVEYELTNNDEAAILAEYAARRLRTIDAELSRESARLALAADEQEFYARPEAQRAVLARIGVPIAEFLIHNWPDHERANEARVSLARLFDRAKQPVAAAQWYAGVTLSSEQYAEAQTGAGREYWVASQSVPKQLAGGKPRESQVNEWTSLAEKYLKTGIERAGTPADSAGNPPDWLTVGKAALANLEIGLGHYDEAVKLLTDPPHSPVDAVAVTDEASRPSEGVKGRPFASYVFQSLLRAQIGQHRVDESLGAMQQLEKIAGASGAEGVTGIYVSLGKEIEKEIGRLIASNDRNRLTEVRKSFEKFLEELSRRSDSMTYGSLLWIAETYYGLGEGLSDDPSAAKLYFAKAAQTYDQLLAREAAGPPHKDRLLSLRLRLSNCLRRQGDFERALEMDRSVIAERPKALDVQFAAASTLQDWGASRDPGADRRSLEAIGGVRDASGKGTVWGWAEIAARLQRLLATGKADNEYREKYFEARYNIAVCRRQFAMAQQDAAAKTKALDVALGEINAFAEVSADVGDESWHRLDALYQDIETDLRRPATPLRRPDLRTASAPAAVAMAAEPTTAAVKAAPDTQTGARADRAAANPTGVGRTEGPARSGGPATIWVVLGLLIGVPATAAVCVWSIRRQRSPRVGVRSLGPSQPPDLSALPALPSKPARRVAPTPSARPEERRPNVDGTRPANAGLPRTNPSAPKKAAKPRPQ